MRKVVLPLTGAALVLAATTVQAIDTVNFNGDVVQSCTLSMSSSPLTVDMGKYLTSQFPTQNSSTDNKPFEINISGCANSRIALKWTGKTVPNNSDLLAVDGAVGVGIRVKDLDKNLSASFSQAPDDKMFITMPASGNYKFKLAAYYISYQNNVTAGSANASANVEIVYN